MQDWLRQHLHKRPQQGSDWKLVVYCKKRDAHAMRIFLRKQNFIEWPVKHTTHSFNANDATYKTMVTLLPYAGTTEHTIHVHTEQIHTMHETTFDPWHVKLLNTSPRQLTNVVTPIIKSTIEHGSIFYKPSLCQLAVALVQKTHDETYGKSPTNEKSSGLYICLTWEASTPLAQVQKLVHSLNALIKQFDF